MMEKYQGMHEMGSTAQASGGSGGGSSGGGGSGGSGTYPSAPSTPTSGGTPSNGTHAANNSSAPLAPPFTMEVGARPDHPSVRVTVPAGYEPARGDLQAGGVTPLPGDVTRLVTLDHTWLATVVN
jgi:hypothetical protein